MAVTSNFFLLRLLPCFLLIFYFFRNNNKSRHFLVFTANIVFYFWAGVRAFVLVCVICVVTWLFCNACYRNKSKLLLATGYLIIMLPLLSVKYTGFLFENINTFFNTNLSKPDLLVPMGISFFTFEAISCLSDIYAKKIEKKVSLLDIFLYLTFFPTVVSGPIIRMSNFIEGYDTVLTSVSFNNGIECTVTGLCKKVLIADKIA